MANNKLVNAENLQTVAKGVYQKSQDNLNSVKTDLDGKINAHAGAVVANKKGGAHEADQIRFETDMTIVTAQGGIKAGADLNGMSVQEVLTKLLYPHVKPSVGTVTVSPAPTVREHGNYQKVTSVSASVTKKSNPIAKVELLHNTIVIDTIGDKNLDGNIGTDEKSGTMTGTVTFSNLTVDTVNGDKFTIKAYALNEAGTGYENVKSESTSFTYVYPMYNGVITTGEELTSDLIKGLNKVVETKGNKNYNFTTSQSCAVFAYPKVYGNLVQIYDPSTFPNLAAFTCSEVSVLCNDGTTQNYYVYVSSPSSVNDFNYRFCFTDIK